MSDQFYKSNQWVQTNGDLHRPGKPFLPDASGEVSGDWEKVKPVEKAASEAAEPLGPGHPAFEDMDPTALKALAAQRNVDLRGVTAKKDIITALKASYEPRL